MTTTPNPTAEQIERAAETFYEDPAGLTSWTRLNAAEPDIAERYRVAIGRALTAAGVAPQPVIDEATLTEVVFNAVEKWADMYPTPQVSEMIARAVAAWLKDGSAAQEPRVECLEVRHPSGERQPAYVEPTDRQKLIDEAQAFERAPKLGLSAHRELDKAILLIRRLWPALDAPLDPEKVAAQGAARPVNGFDTTAERVKNAGESSHVLDPDKVAAITWDLVDVSPERQDLLARALCEAYTEGKLTK